MQTTKTSNINYTQLPREEVYQDRDDINDFDIDTPDSIEKRMLICIYNSRIIELDDAERNIIEIFNTAHYITIVLLAQQNPMMSFSWCFKVAGQIGKSPNGEANPDNKLFVAATMGIVVNYLKICDPQYRREENMLICRIAQYFDDLLGITDESVKLFRECCKFVPVEVIDKACNLMSREDFRPLNQTSFKKSTQKIDVDMDFDPLEQQVEELKYEVNQLIKEKSGLEEENMSLREKTSMLERQRYMSDSRVGQAAKERREFWKKFREEANKVQENAFNATTGVTCFTSRQMGILMQAIGYLTEDKAPGKTTLGEVIEKISGYKATTVNQNMKGTFRDADKEVVAKAIESKFPKLAAKVRQI